MNHHKPKPEDCISPFVGTWLCRYYNALDNPFTGPDAIFPPGPFPMTMTQDENGIVSGSFPNPPSPNPAFMLGKLSNDGRVWRGVYSGITTGRIVFLMSDDEQHLHGAWTPGDQDGPPQPWYGVRIPPD